MFDAQWASKGYCLFPLMTAYSLFLMSCGQIFCYIRLKSLEDSFLKLFFDVLVGIWSLAMSIISAVIITLGFIIWCDGMTQRFPTCETPAGQTIFHDDTDHINTSGFYIEMGTAQVSTLHL